MPKAVALTPELVETPQITPKAATPARSVANDTKKPAPKVKPIPLQVRLPRAEVKAIKVAAAQREQTISDFMLACFHAYMKTGKSAS
jgi:hypothetical protein